jgi:acyl carrier protein
MTNKGRLAVKQDHGGKAAVEARVLSITKGVAHEINPQRTVRAKPGSLLQRDLGLDSLALAELLLRTEKEFKIRLPDDLMTRIETASDLIAEVVSASGSEVAKITQHAEWHVGPAADSVPVDEETLMGILDWHVQHNPDRPHILLSDGYRETDSITYRDLSASAARLAAGFRDWGLEPGERIGIMLPTGREFFEAFFGALLAGAVPVPMYPPMRLSQLEEHLRRQAGILRNSQAVLLLIPGEGRQLAGLLGGQIDTLRGVHVVEDMRGAPDAALAVARKSDDIAMLQYTSGSTGDPKGVILTHANLLANIRAMGNFIGASSRDVFVSWLPLYHDLGLIGAWLGSLYYAAPVVVLSPLRFIVRPESWLWAIHRNKATLSAAPNFAFEFCVSKIGDAALEGLDLGSLRMVANGAEPVSPETIRRFTERFRHYGFKPEAMTPVYGLAESSVGLAFSAIEKKPIIEMISREALSASGNASKADETDAHAMSFVSSGMPLQGHEVRIVDSLGRELPERHQGRLEFRGPSATSGYYRLPGKSAELVRDGWLDSSDLAYIANGNIFITGRVKDIIIKGGRNIYPEEIEEAIGSLEGIRKGCVAVFATPDARAGSERLVIVAETRSTDDKVRAQLEQAARDCATDILGMPADEIVIAPPHAVPKTSSGKIRRATTRELYETGKLGKPVRSLWLQVVRLRLMSGVPRIRRFARAVADVAYAVWWWAVLVLLGTIAWSGVLLLPGQARRWKFVRVMARAALWLMGIRLEIHGQDRLTSDVSIIVVNHSSYFDSVVLALVLPGEPAFVAKRELAVQWIAGPFLRRLGTQFTERAMAQAGAEDAEAFKQLAHGGQQLVIFPEATFYRMPGLLPFRLGAFSISCAIASPVLPVVIRGTRSILRGEQWFPRHGDVSIEVLDPQMPGGTDFSAAAELKERVRAAMLASSGEPDMAGNVDVVRQRKDDGQTRN